MFGNKTQIYTVHINPAKAHPIEKSIFVREGFNLTAFIFGIIWSFYNRMWWETAFIVIITILFGLARELKWLDLESIMILQFAFNFIVGLQANDWRRGSLSRRGYIMSDIVVSSDELSAQQRYFDRVLAA